MPDSRLQKALNIVSSTFRWVDGFFHLRERLDKEYAKTKESYALSSDIFVPAPMGKEYDPHQKAAIAYALKRWGTLIADDMGLGKTIEAIGVANAIGAKKILVICPAFLKINWKRELKDWLVDRSLSIGIVNGASSAVKADVAIVNYEQLTKYILKKSWDLLILDEVHYIVNPEAARSQEAYALTPYAGKALFLGGTPNPNGNPMELFHIAKILGAPFAQDKQEFERAFCSGRRNAHESPRKLERLQMKLRSSIMVRREKKDVLLDLPPKRRQIIELPIPPELRGEIEFESAWYANFEKEKGHAQARLSSAKTDEDYKLAVAALRSLKNQRFEEMARMRHRTGLAKVPYNIEYIQNLLNETEKLVVYAWHRDVVIQTAMAFPGISVRVLGGDKMEERVRAEDSFREDPEIRLFIATMRAAGEGLNLQIASDVLFVEGEWSPKTMSQAEDRLHRRGQKKFVMVRHLVFNGSIDANEAKRVVWKQNKIDKTMNRQED